MTGVHTARTRSLAGIPKPALIGVSADADALLKAFPILHHETAQHHKARIEAFQSCWSGLSAHLKVQILPTLLLRLQLLSDALSASLRCSVLLQDVLEKATTSTFKELGAYAKAQQLEGVPCGLWQAPPRPNCAGSCRKHETLQTMLGRSQR